MSLSGTVYTYTAQQTHTHTHKHTARLGAVSSTTDDNAHRVPARKSAHDGDDAGTHDADHAGIADRAGIARARTRTL